jgi:dTDP-4-dehydrorhamnose reductase
MPVSVGICTHGNKVYGGSKRPYLARFGACTPKRHFADPFHKSSTMKILLTGASGYLGQHLLLDWLSKDEHEVHAWTSSKPLPDVLDSPRIHQHTVDISNEAAIKSWFSNDNNKAVDVCIHTAAISSPKLCEQDPDKATAVNVPTHLFDALQQHAIPCIALSTDQVYPGDEPPYLETDGPLTPVNHYGVTKLQMEDELIKRLGSRAAILRSSLIVGLKAPQAHETFLHFCAQQVETTDYYTNERRSVVALSNVIQTINCLVDNMDKRTCNILNMGGPRSASRYEMASAVCQHLGKNASLVRAVERPAEGNSPLDITMDSSKLYELTGLQFADLEQMVKLTFDSHDKSA